MRAHPPEPKRLLGAGDGRDLRDLLVDRAVGVQQVLPGRCLVEYRLANLVVTPVAGEALLAMEKEIPKANS